MAYLPPYRTTRRRAGAGRAMGDVASGPSPLAALAAQVNRFGASAPVAYQFVPVPVTVASGNLTMDLALPAVLIYQRRATDAFSQFHDMGSEAAITRANSGLKDPVGFVSENMGEVITTISSFADSLGLPASSGIAALTGLSSTTLVMIAAGGAAALLMLRRGRR